MTTQQKRQHYRALPCYNHSFLSAVKRYLQGKPQKQETPYLTFGKIIHSVLLDGECLDTFDLTPARRRDAEAIIKTANEHSFLSLILRSPILQRERPVTWTDRQQRVLCKGLVDLLNEFVEGYDLKTTMATTQRQFEQEARKYEYARQAAFYMDGAKLGRFTVIAIGKRKPYPIFTITYTKRQKEIDLARKRYRFLLRKCRELGIPPNYEFGDIA